jgi:hypothetical protein
MVRLVTISVAIIIAWLGVAIFTMPRAIDPSIANPWPSGETTSAIADRLLDRPGLERTRPEQNCVGQWRFIIGPTIYCVTQAWSVDPIEPRYVVPAGPEGNFGPIVAAQMTNGALLPALSSVGH